MNVKEIEQEARKRIAEIDGEIAKLQAEKVRLQQMVGPTPEPVKPFVMPSVPFDPSWQYGSGEVRALPYTVYVPGSLSIPGTKCEARTVCGGASWSFDPDVQFTT